MCGRFTLHMPWSELVKLYRVHDRPNLKPRYNIAPTQDILAIRLDQDGQQEPVQLRWGLIPFWAKDGQDRLQHDQRACGDGCKEASLPGRLQEAPLPDRRRRVLRVEEA